MVSKRAWMVGLVLLGWMMALPVQAQENDDVKASIAEMEERLDYYRRRLKTLEDKVADGDQAQEAAQVVEDIEAEEGAGMDLPKWLKDLMFSGDLRLRYEGQIRNSNTGASNGKDRHRGRFRLRFGIKKMLMDDQMTVAFRLASSDTAGPTSTSQTFDTVFTEKALWIDRAYAKYMPKDVEGLVIIGGKMPNPFFHTDMVWDSDLNPEGVAASMALPMEDMEGVAPFVTAGYLIVDEDNATNNASHDTVLWALQVGTEIAAMDGMEWTAAGTYYLYDFHRGTTGAAFLGAVNVENWHVVNLTNKFEFMIEDLPAMAYLDLAYNCGEEDNRRRLEDDNKAIAVGLKVGENKKEGDFSASYKYAHIEANSVPALNDADFGFTNVRGHVVRGAYNLADNVTIGANVFLVKPIVGGSGARFLTVQGDVIWSF